MEGKNGFESMADQNWRVCVDADDIYSPSLCYPDPKRAKCFVGPLAIVPVGTSEENEEGDQVLDLSDAGGRDLVAIACLPHIASLFRWIRESVGKLGVSQDGEYNQFVDSLSDRVAWIVELIDGRPETMNPGMHGFERYHEEGRDDANA